MTRRRPRGAGWLPLPAAADQYSGYISVRTLRRLAAAGIIRGRRVGRCWDVVAADLHRYMRAKERR